MMMSVVLHPLVKALAKDVTLREGRLALEEVRVVAAREAMLTLDVIQKRSVVASLVAFATRLMREAKTGSEETVEKLMALAASLS